MAHLYFWGKPITKQFFQKSEHLLQIARLEMAVLDVSCGEKHAVILSVSGQAYGMGDNSQGQLGDEDKKNNVSGLSKILIMDNYQKIQSVSCGWNHTLLLDSKGNVYSSGINKFGQIGRGKNSHGNRFDLVLMGAKQISAGKDHSLALVGYKVMGWGNSNEGQLGLISKKSYFAPQELNIYPCKSIYAGCKYSLFITTKGVFGTGLNEDCQLGLGHQNNIYVPRRLNIQEQVTFINGGSYSVAKNIDSQWYVWGTGGFGVFKYPTKMSFLKGSERVSLGKNFGALYQNDKFWVWGNNLWGQFGVQNEFIEHVHEVQSVSDLMLTNIEFGGNFMIGFKRSSHQNKLSLKTNFLNESLESQLFKGLKKSQESFEQQNQKIFLDNGWIENHYKQNSVYLMKSKQYKKEDSESIKPKQRKYSEQWSRNNNRPTYQKKQLSTINRQWDNILSEASVKQKKVNLKSTIRSFYNDKYHSIENTKNIDEKRLKTQYKSQEYKRSNYVDLIKESISSKQSSEQKENASKFDFQHFNNKLLNLKSIVEEMCQ